MPDYIVYLESNENSCVSIRLKDLLKWRNAIPGNRYHVNLSNYHLGIFVNYLIYNFWNCDYETAKHICSIVDIAFEGICVD